MNKKINLIPTEMAVPARAVKFAAFLKKTTVVGGILIVVAFVLVLGLYFFKNSQNTNATINIATLKSQITNLEKSEQKLVLAKDRLEKIKTVKNLKSVNNEIKRFENMSSVITLESGLNMTEADLKPTSSEVTVIAGNKDSLKILLEPLASLNEYSNVVISSLGYASGSGYVVNLNFEAKQ